MLLQPPSHQGHPTFLLRETRNPGLSRLALPECVQVRAGRRGAQTLLQDKPAAASPRAPDALGTASGLPSPPQAPQDPACCPAARHRAGQEGCGQKTTGRNPPPKRPATTPGCRLFLPPSCLSLLRGAVRLRSLRRLRPGNLLPSFGAGMWPFFRVSSLYSFIIRGKLLFFLCFTHYIPHSLKDVP